MDTTYEPYLNKIHTKKYKFALSRLRLSSHILQSKQAVIMELPERKEIV